MSRLKFALLVLVAVCHQPAALADNAELLTAAFENGAIRVSGVTRGGELAVFGISREQVQFSYVHTTKERHVVTDSGNAGQVVFTPRVTATSRVLWAFVDITTGRHLLTTPSGPAGVQQFDPRVVSLTGGAGDDRVTIRLAAADVLLVIPGEGVWSETVFDGGGADDDFAANGITLLKADKLKPLKSKPKKDKFKKDDLLIVIDPLTLRVFAGRLK